ncbi:MAG: TraB/GumN family protein [Pseudomonadota bacterium]
MFLILHCLLAQAAGAAERGALFKVQGGGHTMYLFGTMHVGLPEFYPLEPQISGALAGASALALEIDPLQDPAAMAAAVQELGMVGSAGASEPGAPLKARLARALARAQIDPATAARFKPWMLATLLALTEYAAQGYRTDLAVDLYLAQQARAGKVPVIELESVRAQLGLFGRLSADQQWRYLEDSIDTIEAGKQDAEVRQIVDAWSHADQGALERIAEQAAQDQSVSGKFVQQVMIEERNGPLADKLAALLARQDKVVAAIGVLHLVGAHSVPKQLRARGITVERLY